MPESFSNLAASSIYPGTAPDRVRIVSILFTLVFVSLTDTGH
jgi:hypothetical protein